MSQDAYDELREAMDAYRAHRAEEERAAKERNRESSERVDARWRHLNPLFAEAVSASECWVQGLPSILRRTALEAKLRITVRKEPGAILLDLPCGTDRRFVDYDGCPGWRPSAHIPKGASFVRLDADVMSFVVPAGEGEKSFPVRAPRRMPEDGGRAFEKSVMLAVLAEQMVKLQGHLGLR